MCSVFLLRTVSEAYATQSGGKGSTTKCPTLEVGKMVGFIPIFKARLCHRKCIALTFVSDCVTNLPPCSFEGRIPDAIRSVEQGAAPARGFALRSRAALGIMPSGTTAGAWGASTGLGQARAGNARRTRRPRKPGLELSHDVKVVARAAAERRKASAPRKQMSCADRVHLSAARIRARASAQRRRLSVLRGPNEFAPFGASLPRLFRGTESNRPRTLTRRENDPCYPSGIARGE